MLIDKKTAVFRKLFKFTVRITRFHLFACSRGKLLNGALFTVSSFERIVKHKLAVRRHKQGELFQKQGKLLLFKIMAQTESADKGVLILIVSGRNQLFFKVL